MVLSTLVSTLPCWGRRISSPPSWCPCSCAHTWSCSSFCCGRAKARALSDLAVKLVAMQQGQEFVTTGLYGAIQHPSYRALLVNAFGWALAFRSSIGILLTVLMIPQIVARIRSEEALKSVRLRAVHPVSWLRRLLRQ